MDKLRMQSLDKTKCNVEKLKELFPSAVTEVKGADGKIDYAIDFDVLKQELSSEIVEGREERYQFTWPGKREAILLANTPITKTLRPCKKESVDFDNTQNLYIEGDNLEVLKLLQEPYLGKVKMIYIDPPYNTGNDFIYNDTFTQSKELFDESTGARDEEGNRLFQNTESNGRFHSDWCSMIYPRLKLAKDLLSDDGVIFISIDDNEQENLKKICDDVFGAGNFIAQLVWERAFSPKNDAKYVSNSHDYVLMYSKRINAFKIGRLPRTEEADARYSNPDNDPRGVWMSGDMSAKTYSPADDYPITTPSGKVINPPPGRCWRFSKEAFAERVKDNQIWFGPDGAGTPRIKRFLSELRRPGMAPTSILFHKDVGHSQEGAQETTKLLKAGVFDGPKPVRFLKRLLTLAHLDKDSIVLDFFAGSGTTAHAVMQLNAEDGGHRKFIMVQLPEKCDEGGEAAKAGYENICEIGKERIRRAGKKILEENPSARGSLDVGFRVLKLDSSNMEDVYYDPASTKQGELSIVNVKTDRTSLDLLFQVMLEFDKPLSSKIEETKICGKTVFKVDGDDLICCFDEEISDELVTEIAKLKPLYAVFRDSSFNGDSVCVNCGPIFTKFSPATKYRII